jgi:hypothetical protein
MGHGETHGGKDRTRWKKDEDELEEKKEDESMTHRVH